MNTAARVGAVLLAAAIVVLLSTRGDDFLLVAGLAIGLVALVAREIFLRRGPVEDEELEEEPDAEAYLDDEEFEDEEYPEDLDPDGAYPEPDLEDPGYPEDVGDEELPGAPAPEDATRAAGGLPEERPHGRGDGRDERP